MKVLVVDDHTLFREGLCYVLDKLDENIEVLEAPDFENAMRKVIDNPDLDLVLLDLNIPGKDGFVALDMLSNKYPALPVVILSASLEQCDVMRSIDSGAMGYIPKDTPGAVVLNALRLVLSGGKYVPMDLVQQNSLHDVGATSVSAVTPRQFEVLELLARGDSNKVIAAKLSVTEATVKMHMTSIFRSLGVSNRTQAAIVAEKMGLSISKD